MTKYEVTVWWRKGNAQSFPMITGVQAAEGVIKIESNIQGAPYFGKLIPLDAVDCVDVQEQVYRS